MIDLKTQDNQAHRYIEYLGNMANKEKITTILKYITTSDTRIDQDIFKLGAERNVIVSQSYLMWDPVDDCFYIGNSVIDNFTAIVNGNMFGLLAGAGVTIIERWEWSFATLDGVKPDGTPLFVRPNIDNTPEK